MAVLPNVNPTFADLQKMLDPNGQVGAIAEVLNTTNEGMDEMTVMEGNLTTGHRHMIRTGLPEVTWGQLYKGVKPSRGTTVQATDTVGFLESLSEVDARLLDLAPDRMAFRFAEDRPHLEAMSQEMWKTVFYGTAAEADKFIGLTPRFNDLTADNADNIILGGSADNTADKGSIWLIAWSPRSVFGIIPKGSKAGLQQVDEGLDWAFDAAGGRYKVALTYFRWDLGLAVPDWRYVVRIPNIRLSEVTKDAATGPDLAALMVEAMERLPSDAWSNMRVAFYMPRPLVFRLRTQLIAATKNSTLKLEQVGGAGEVSVKRKLFFDGVPVNRMDTLTFTEARLS